MEKSREDKGRNNKEDGDGRNRRKGRLEEERMIRKQEREEKSKRGRSNA